MPDTVIRVENLGKRYIIGHQQQEKYTALRDVLTNKAKDITKFLNLKSKNQNSNLEEFWALKDISFEVKQGDRIGIIGRNGAGKSTLLKILSRITEPTEGRISIKGRIASLLEVGTGFHPELTGRENIFLNGAILGMGKQEIRYKFDEIVAFAEVEKFLDTPVKRYSSGMYVRLAFAVAAHLEPEILVVDEVLAVGDAAFQKKCLGKMEHVAEKEGRTVLFVSHNIAAIQSLCNKGITLQAGKIQYMGKIHKTISAYISNLERVLTVNLAQRSYENATYEKRAWFTEIRFHCPSGTMSNTALSGEPLIIELFYYAMQESMNLSFNIGIYNFMREKILHLSTDFSYTKLNNLPKTGSVICHIPKLPLTEGRYAINLSLHELGDRLDHIADAAELIIHAGDFYSTGKLPQIQEAKFLVDHDWKVKA